MISLWNPSEIPPRSSSGISPQNSSAIILGTLFGIPSRLPWILLPEFLQDLFPEVLVELLTGFFLKLRELLPGFFGEILRIFIFRNFIQYFSRNSMTDSSTSFYCNSCRSFWSSSGSLFWNSSTYTWDGNTSKVYFRNPLEVVFVALFMDILKVFFMKFLQKVAEYRCAYRVGYMDPMYDEIIWRTFQLLKRNFHYRLNLSRPTFFPISYFF